MFYIYKRICNYIIYININCKEWHHVWSTWYLIDDFVTVFELWCVIEEILNYFRVRF